MYVYEFYEKSSNVKLKQLNNAQNLMFHFVCQRSFSLMRPAAWRVIKSIKSSFLIAVWMFACTIFP